MTAPQLIDIGKVIPNPHNPRIIRDEKFAKLVKSVKEFPEMGQLRPIIVNEEMQILGGNMRYRAMKEAGLKKIPVVIASISTDKQREFIIKDNVGFGEWDWSLLANEWEANDLEDWGVEVPGITKDLSQLIDDREEALYEPMFFLNIQCKDENDCKKLYAELIDRGLTVKIVQ